MSNCWSLGVFFVVFLGSFCFWNCLRRNEDKKTADWYGCVDQLGEPTDFYTIYKLPKDGNSFFPFVSRGIAYIHLTPDSETRLQSGGISSVLSYSDSYSNWVLSNVSIDKENSMPGRTLRRLYQDNSFKNVAAYVMYNDEFPNGTVSLAHGHSKGVVVLSELGGFWLVHSVPKYPPSPDLVYNYPSTGERYGQTMLCISLPPVTASLANNIALHLLENDIFAYAHHVPANLASKYPLLEEAMTGRSKTPRRPPFYKVAGIASILGKTFTAFAKNKKFDNDLYSHLISPVMKTSLFVESWRNGIEPLPPSCSKPYVVENIASVSVAAAGSAFSSHHDHAKWAVGQNADLPVVCVGDINRMETQFKRGGGAVCISSLSLWYRFKSLIRDVDKCPATPTFSSDVFL